MSPLLMEGDILRDGFQQPVGGREKARRDGCRATWVTPRKLFTWLYPTFPTNEMRY